MDSRRISVTLRHWSHANELMASVLAPNERQLSRVFYLALTSGLARQNISSFRDDRASFPPPSLRHIYLSPFLPFFFFITSWPVSKATSLVNRLFLFFTLIRTTRRISDSGVTRYAIRSRARKRA